MTLCADWFEVGDVLGDDALCEPCADVSEDVMEEAITAACEILYELTDRDFPGVCTETVRPCGSHVRAAARAHGYAVSPGGWANVDGWLVNVGGGGCGCDGGRPCGCGGHHELRPHRTQLRSVESLTLDGVTYTAADLVPIVRIEDWRYFVRIDGEAWPCCQDLDAPLGEPDTFGITYTYGGLPPTSIKRAAMNLACQLARAYCGSDCDLPPNLSNLTRQGIQMAVVNLTQAPDSEIGLPAVDNAVKARRYGKNNRGAAIFSPDRRQRTRKVTWP